MALAVAVDDDADAVVSCAAAWHLPQPYHLAHPPLPPPGRVPPDPPRARKPSA